MTEPILRLQDLRVDFATPLGQAHALRGVSLDVEPATVLGLVGESGCGKTVTGRAILGLLPANASVSGRVIFDGVDLLTLGATAMQRIRGKRIAMIFQDPAAALNPVFTIGDQLLSVLRHHRMATGGAARRLAESLLMEVGLPDPPRILTQYPHQLSGGMQQRAMIAIALSASPELLVADEPTTALDVTIQAQILELLIGLRKSRGLTVILITHNMRVVQTTCQRVAVFYAGRVVEEGPVASTLEGPQHPYTAALLSSLPTAAGRRRPLAVIPGLVPTTREEIEGCVFASRCPHVMPICKQEPPEYRVAPGSRAYCWLHASTELTSFA